MKKVKSITEELSGNGAVTSIIEGVGKVKISTSGLWEGLLVIETSDDNGETWYADTVIDNLTDKRLITTIYTADSPISIRAIMPYWKSGACEISIGFI